MQSSSSNNTTVNQHGATVLSCSDAQTLSIEMSKHVRGEVRLDDGSRALCATDGSNSRQTLIGVVLPESKQDVVNAIRVARKFGAPITGRSFGIREGGIACALLCVVRGLGRCAPPPPFHFPVITP